VTEPSELKSEEGWFQDHFRIHQDRWYSYGVPTALVRDAGVESHDRPPSQDPPTQPLDPVATDGEAPGPDDLRRADDAEAEQNPDYSGRVFDVAALDFPMH
jgi:hypothetical protein